jgi:hypothetical protein
MMGQLLRSALIKVFAIILTAGVVGFLWYCEDEKRAAVRQIEKKIEADAKMLVDLAEAAPNREDFWLHTRSLSGFRVVSQNAKLIVFEAVNTNTAYGRYTIVVCYPSYESQ